MSHIVFRTDASRAIGTGHVVRCLSLATALREAGATVSFICRAHEGHLCALLAERGFIVHELPLSEVKPDGHLGAPWHDDASQTRAILDGVKPDWLVVDHYALDWRWEEALRHAVGRIMVIDDLANRGHDCDLLLDQNMAKDAEQRYASRVPAACRRLLGPRYALLQPQYAQLHVETSPRQGPVRRILLFFGGADSDRLTERAMQAMIALQRPDIAVDVVVGAANPEREKLLALAAAHPQFTVHGALPSLAPLMQAADLTVGAGGSTCWERLCLGLPCITVTVADNQRPATALLAECGLTEWIGDAAGLTVADLQQALQRWCEQGVPKGWFPDYAELVDGKGVARVCAALLGMSET